MSRRHAGRWCRASLVRPLRVTLMASVATLLFLGGCSERKLAAKPAFQGSKVIRPTIAFQIMRDNPDLVVLDLRAKDEFHGPHGHIIRATNVPLHTLADFLKDARLPTDRALLVYCDRTNCCEHGHDVLAESGFRYIFRIEDGIEAWIAAGFGTVKEGVNAPGPS